MAENRITIDLQDRIRAIDERLEEIEAEAAEADPDSAAYQDYREEYEELAEAKDTIGEKIDAWGGSQFAIKAEIKWADQVLVNDLFRGDTKAGETDDPETKFGALKRRMVQVYTTETPPDAPEDPRDYPPVVGEWLYQQIDNLTRFGEADVGNWRLDQALSTTE